jgi:glycine cleavage system H protein
MLAIIVKSTERVIRFVFESMPELNELSESHFWTRPAGEEGVVRLGLNSDYAESMKGPWLALEIAETGSHIQRGDTFGFLTTGPATYDLVAPFAFKVVRVNRQVLENPDLARFSPHHQGWLAEILPGD